MNNFVGMRVGRPRRNRKSLYPENPVYDLAGPQFPGRFDDSWLKSPWKMGVFENRKHSFSGKQITGLTVQSNLYLEKIRRFGIETI